MKIKQIRSPGSSQHLYYFSCQHHYNIYIRLLRIHLSEGTIEAQKHERGVEEHESYIRNLK